MYLYILSLLYIHVLYLAHTNIYLVFSAGEKQMLWGVYAPSLTPNPNLQHLSLALTPHSFAAFLLNSFLSAMHTS